jgi:hypothetical protein
MKWIRSFISKRKKKFFATVFVNSLFAYCVINSEEGYPACNVRGDANVDQFE